MSNNGFIVNLTHDIDFIKKTYQYLTHDLLKFKIANLKHLFSRNDPFWTFDQIMKIEDKLGCRSTFFFLEETIPWDLFSINRWNLAIGKYRFADPEVTALIKKLDKNGWEIALHGSYNSYRDKELLGKEKNNLEAVVEKKVNGVRQHFLNLEIPQTWKIQKELGFLYDASLGKKKEVGFFNNYYTPRKNKESGLLIIPLAVMDTYISLICKNDTNKAWSYILKVINEAEKNNAVLSVLWHNNFFNENEHPGFLKLYHKFIWECKNRGARFLTSYQVYKMYENQEAELSVTDASPNRD